MKRFLITLLIPLVVFSCNNIEKPAKPDNLISRDKMVDVLTDISLMTAAKGINKRLLEENAINPQNYIYEKYNIDSTQFAESSNYYAYDIKDYEKIYLKVKERLEMQKEKIAALQEKEKKEKDSIREVKKKEIDSIKNLNLNKNRKLNSLTDKIPEKAK